MTVVIAVWRNAAGLDACLDALQPQAESDPHVTVLVVADFAVPSGFMERRRWARWITEPGDRLIPDLWGRGIREGRDDFVALTTAHFTPAHDWIERMRDAHGRSDAAGVGGAFDPPRGRGPGDWATYFLRYGKYLPLRAACEVHDIAADNASYKRRSLDAHPESFVAGFWEADFHRIVRAEGASLTFDPAIRVTQRASFGVRRFCRQRLHHGRQFGGARMRGRGRASRWAATLALPLIPPVLLLKVAGWVRRSGRDYGAFLACLPVLSLFVGSWAVGEVWGYVSAGDGTHHA